jgi:hypothetical protein
LTRRSRRPLRSAQAGAAPSGPASRSAARPAQRDADSSPTPAASAATATPRISDRPISRGPSGTERAGRRERPARAYRDRRSFAERHRGSIIGIGIAVIVAAVTGFVFFQSTQKAYACSSIFDPSPTPTASTVTGYQQRDMSNPHINVGAFQRYLNCPPASGPHYNAVGVAGPIPAKFYGPDETLVPQNWVHNLEHGAVVILYSCDKGACDSATQAQLQQIPVGFPNSPRCNIPPGGNVAPVIARFEDMPHKFAALVWDRVLYQDALDVDQIKAFYKNEAENGNPEPLCPASPSPSAGASASPSASPGASGSESPAASGSSQPSPSPATSASPSPSS